MIKKDMSETVRPSDDFFAALYQLNIFDYLLEFDNSEERLKYLLPIVSKDREANGSLIAAIKAARGQSAEDALLLEDAIRLMGVHNSRVFLIALGISNFVKSKMLQKDPKTGKIASSPEKLLGYANKALQHFGEDSRYKDTAFNAGLLYDLMVLYVNREGAKDVAKYEEAIGKSFAYACAVASKTIELGVRMNSLTLDKHIPTVCLLGEFGHLVNSLDSPTHLDTFKNIANTEYGVQTRAAIDEKLVSRTRFEVGAWLASVFPILAEASSALYYFTTPFAIHKYDKNSHALAAAVLMGYFCSDSSEFDNTVKASSHFSSLRPEFAELP